MSNGNQVILQGDSTASEVLAPTAQSPSIITVQSEPPQQTPQQEQRPSPQQPAKPAVQQAPPPSPAKQEDSEVFEVGGVDVSDIAKEYEETGSLSEESYKELSDNGFPKEVVDAYLRGLEQSSSDAGELARSEVEKIITEVGGLEKYERVMAWAAEKLSQEEQDAYDKAVSANNPTMARLVVQGLMSRYEREYGVQPNLVTGGRSNEASIEGSSFASRSDMIQAMSDKRYGTDPDYTREVEAKVIRSGIMRGNR